MCMYVSGLRRSRRALLSWMSTSGNLTIKTHVLGHAHHSQEQSTSYCHWPWPYPPPPPFFFPAVKVGPSLGCVPQFSAHSLPSLPKCSLLLAACPPSLVSHGAVQTQITSVFPWISQLLLNIQRLADVICRIGKQLFYVLARSFIMIPQPRWNQYNFLQLSKLSVIQIIKKVLYSTSSKVSGWSQNCVSFPWESINS